MAGKNRNAVMAMKAMPIGTRNRTRPPSKRSGLVDKQTTTPASDTPLNRSDCTSPYFAPSR